MKDCQMLRLAGNRTVKIDWCDCGTVHIHCGTHTMRLTQKAFRDMASAMRTATQNLSLDSRSTALVGWD